MSPYILSFDEIDSTKTELVGGKGARLGELTRIPGIQVPQGFCITTAAYREMTENNSAMNFLLNELDNLKTNNRKEIADISINIRKEIEAIAIPAHIRKAIVDQLEIFVKNQVYAIRSSATAEDLPSASFAGQQDSFLNIQGTDAILKHICKCWASLYTERAIIYRIQNHFEHGKVYLSVIVQKMIFPDAAGILFTADPASSNRKISAIDASLGLGEALVSGLVNADHYKVGNGSIIEKKISTKKLAIFPSGNSGTKAQEISPEQQNLQTLNDGQILQLEQLGKTIESHFAEPQDIEWCLDNGNFYIVQSRPITTLYPIPEVKDQAKHIYVSVGHNQMMTDAMKPLGLSFFLLTTSAPMHIAGGRLFVDITTHLSTAAGRQRIMDTLGKSEPLMKDALINLMERPDLIKKEPGEEFGKHTPVTPASILIEDDPVIVSNLIKKHELSLEACKQAIQDKSGSELFDFILEDMPRLKQVASDPQHLQVIMAGFNASAWINEKMHEWLGEKNVADTLSQSVPDNITSKMGLELMDVADMIRPHSELIEFLQHVKNGDFMNEMTQFEGGEAALAVISEFLRKYGMRCSGEIDISKPRWSEQPSILLPIILSHIKNFKPNAGKQKFEQGLQEAIQKERELIQRLKQLPDAEEKVKETQRMISYIRHFIGYREYPKYFIVNRYFIYRQALLKEAEQLQHKGIIQQRDDIFFLYFEELRELVRTGHANYDLINKRKEEYSKYTKLMPPRLMTSDGEIINGSYKRENLPRGSMAGLAVSSGIAEGRARVILDMENAEISEGDILITRFTDPSWTPLFVSIKALVTEVGGLMTHGAVIAREYGLPAVVGVENATSLIRDGQRIRVNGIVGYVEILS